MEALLLLCSEMDQGLGLTVTSRSHGRTAAQLLQRVCPPKFSAPAWPRKAAKHGHINALAWLLENMPKKYFTGSNRILSNVISAVLRAGHLHVFRWLAETNRLDMHM